MFATQFSHVMQGGAQISHCQLKPIHVYESIVMESLSHFSDSAVLAWLYIYYDSDLFTFISFLISDVLVFESGSLDSFCGPAYLYHYIHFAPSSFLLLHNGMIL